MGTTKERLEALESGLGLVQDELQKISLGVNDKFLGMETKYQTIKTSMARILELLAQNGSGESSTPAVNLLPVPLPRLNPQPEHNPPPPPNPQPENNAPMHPPQYPPLNLQPLRHIKLNFPRFNGGDMTEWLSKAKQYFAYHGVPRAQQVSFASYHLTEEANEWWLATSTALGINPNNSPWETFEEELWNRFGPTEGENFHEDLTKIKQTGTLREYQPEFERLMNKVDNWSEKALVGSYSGGLHASIVDHIRMFATNTLKSVINLARLHDDQYNAKAKGDFSLTTTPPPLQTRMVPLQLVTNLRKHRRG